MSLAEFHAMGASSGDDFNEQSNNEDFRLHDFDGNGRLNREEFGRLLQGHELLADSIEKVIEAADSDGDGHLHLEHEVPHRLEDLLDSEFVEDFFFHSLAE